MLWVSQSTSSVVQSCLLTFEGSLKQVSPKLYSGHDTLAYFLSTFNMLYLCFLIFISCQTISTTLTKYIYIYMFYSAFTLLPHSLLFCKRICFCFANLMCWVDVRKQIFTTQQKELPPSLFRWYYKILCFYAGLFNRAKIIIHSPVLIL